MKLMLKLVSPASVEIDNIILNQNAATLGRNEDNTLVLEDSKKYISGHHALIDYRTPDYFITDTSTNGVFINDAPQPVGNGNSAKLRTGDQLKIGDYLVFVTIIDGQDNTSDIISKPLFNQSVDFSNDPFLDLDVDSIQNMIDENQLIPSDLKVKASNPDPFNIEEEDNENNIEIDEPSVFKDAFHLSKSEKKEQYPVVDEDIVATNWYEVSQKKKNNPTEELFPEDCFSDKKSLLDSSLDSKPAIQQHDKVVDEAEKVMWNNNPTNPPQTIIENFLSGAGLENSGINESLTPEFFFIIGRILRTSVQGTMDVLNGRAKIKNEMHLDATMFRSGENNPIKFSVNAEEALRKLLSPQTSGYLPAEKAISEVFDDIQAHQYSVIAGMETALLDVLKKFDPDKLEFQLREKSPISASIPIQKQVKLWRSFKILYNETQCEAEDNFHLLFGQTFAETYEQQINELKKTKKENPF